MSTAKQFASTSWDMDDAIEAATELKVQITEKEAVAILEENEDSILEAASEAGWKILRGKVAAYVMIRDTDGSKHDIRKMNQAVLERMRSKLKAQKAEG